MCTDLAVFVGAVVPFSATDAWDMSMPRNVLMIVVDQWRGDFLPAMGADWLDLPNLQQLCAEGVTFGRHFAQATPCGPARSSLLTGLYLMNHRHVRNTVPLDNRHTNLAREVRKHGYEPALVGYTDTTPDPRITPPGDPEFRVLGGTMPGWVPVATYIDPGRLGYFSWLAARGFDVPADPKDVWLPRDGELFRGPAAVPAEHSDTAWSAEMALSYLHQRADQKWLLHVGFLRPHPPFIAPAPYHRAYQPDALPGSQRAEHWQDEAQQHPFMAEVLARTPVSDYVRGAPGLVRDLSEADIQAMRAAYFGLMTEVDHHLGRLFDFLKAQGLWDDTLIVFTSDHGEHLGDHYLFGKHTFYDQSFRIPLIIRDPSKSADTTRGTIVREFTESVDLMPTILDWVGADIPRTCDGVNLRQFLEGQAANPWRAEAHFEYDFRDTVDDRTASALGLSNDQANLCALRGPRFKYVHFANLPPILFDLADDPDEMRNVAGEPAMAVAALECSQAMLSWRLSFAERTLTGYRASAEHGLIEMP